MAPISMTSSQIVPRIAEMSAPIGIGDGRNEARHEGDEETRQEGAADGKQKQDHQPLVLQKAGAGTDQKARTEKLQHHDRAQGRPREALREAAPDRKIGQCTEGRRDQKRDHQDEQRQGQEDQDNPAQNAEEGQDQRHDPLNAGDGAHRPDEVDGHQEKRPGEARINQGQHADAEARGSLVGLRNTLGRQGQPQPDLGQDGQQEAERAKKEEADLHGIHLPPPLSVFLLHGHVRHDRRRRAGRVR